MSGPTLILDNYDSFTFNLFQQVARLQDGQEPLVYRNDALDLPALRKLSPGRIIISPGPGHPAQPRYMGIGLEVIRELGPRVPILGVCLGHLAMIQALGGRVERAPQPRHGKTSPVLHRQQDIFAGLPSPLEVMRYHSLVGLREGLPADLEVTAWTQEGLIMAVRHREWPMTGVQFHPESIGTTQGDRLVARWLHQAV